MSGPNTSTAVMAARASAPDALDFFPTPPWAARALCPLLGTDDELGGWSCWDPAAGAGHLLRGLGDHFGAVHGSDIHDYDAGYPLGDFLADWPSDGLLGNWQPPEAPDWIVTNPPFAQGLGFALAALGRARLGVALLVRTAFTEGGRRYRELFRPQPPSWNFQFVERVVMAKGICRNPDLPYWDGRRWKLPTTATAYCWLVWHTGAGRARRTLYDWIPPCRRQLQRAEDYDPHEQPPPGLGGRL